MLRREIGTTFSDLWYRTGPTRPRLSPHAQIVRQRYGPEVSYIIEEPAAGTYYRISEAAYAFVAALDGTRTVQEAWDACNAQLGDAAPTQRQCIDVLSRLQHHGLLMGELPLAPDLVLERKAQARRRRMERRTGRWLFYSVPVLNPEPWLERHERAIRLAFSWVGAVVWLAVAGVALGMVAANWGRFSSALNMAGLLHPENLAWMGAVFLVLRGLHEMGHAMACKAFGGRVTEIGLILIMLVLPLPYCDASSSWRFPSIRHRVIVSMGGVIVEGFAAAIAGIIWAVAEPGLLSSICYNVMIVSGVVTLLFNLNPLLRYDGYYVLSDLAGSPNLAQRSKDLWKAGVHRWLFGVKSVHGPAIRDGAEAALLWAYSALSAPYRMMILTAIILVLFEFAPTIGVILGAIMIAVAVVWPVLKGIGYLASSPALVGHRARAVAVTAAGVGGLAAVLGLVPVRASAYAPGVVEARSVAPVRAGEAGFVRAVLTEPHGSVEEGATVVELENPEVEAQLEVARVGVRRARAMLRKARDASPGEQELAEKDLAVALAEVRRLEARAAALRVTAPASGRFVAASVESPDLRNDQGRFIERGTLLGSVETTGDLVVRVLVSDREYARLRLAGLGAGEERAGGRDIEVKVRGLAERTIPARVVRDVAVGSRELTDPALAANTGGSILLDPKDPSGGLALRPHFLIELAAAEGAELPPTAQPGQRAWVRFPLPAEPLASQWLRMARQYLRGRLG